MNRLGVWAVAAWACLLIVGCQMTTGTPSDGGNGAPILDNPRWGWLRVSTGWYGGCGIYRPKDQVALGAGELYCWGYISGLSTEYPTRVTASHTSLWVDVSVGWDHVCGITEAQRIFCAGRDNFGQIDGISVDKNYDRFVSPFIGMPLEARESYEQKRWTSISSGAALTFAVADDSTLWRWGEAEVGLPPPIFEAFGVNWRQVGSQYGNAIDLKFCAVTMSDELRCGTAENNDSWKVVPGRWENVGAGLTHWCAQEKPSGRVRCAGGNMSGQLGDGSINRYDSEPAFLAGDFRDTAWLKVSPGSEHTCAIRKDDGKLFCWGKSGQGQLGNGNLDSTNNNRLGNGTIIRATGCKREGSVGLNWTNCSYPLLVSRREKGR
jgi:alpha-tubulin suppressor-like RCC1 family protein